MAEELTGRRLDAAVAAALGHTVEWIEGRPWCLNRPEPELHGKWCGRTLAPHYSADIGKAWGLVNHLRAAGWLVIVKEMPDGVPFLAFEDTQIRVRAICELQWMRRDTPEDTRRFIGGRNVGMGDSAAEAICRAFLALGESKDG